MGVCNCSMFYCTFLCVHSSIAILLMGKRELVALLNLSSWYLVIGEGLFHALPWGYLLFVIVVFPDHTHLLYLTNNIRSAVLKRVFYALQKNFGRHLVIALSVHLSVCPSVHPVVRPKFVSSPYLLYSLR